MVKGLEKGVRMHECAKQVSAKMYPHTFQYGYIYIYLCVDISWGLPKPCNSG